jgi:hypothetical protein
VAKALRAWSSAKIGSVRLQLAIAREVILSLDEAQENRQLAQWESDLRKTLKLRVLGLACLARTIARQRSRILFLAEGDANTKFYHLQACHRSRKSRIDSLHVQGGEVVSDAAMADTLFDYFNSIIGANFERSRNINLAAIGVPDMELSALEALFTVEEVRSVIVELPSDKAPGPDGFTGLFYKKTWERILVPRSKKI